MLEMFIPPGFKPSWSSLASCSLSVVLRALFDVATYKNRREERGSHLELSLIPDWTPISARDPRREINRLRLFAFSASCWAVRYHNCWAWRIFLLLPLGLWGCGRAPAIDQMSPDCCRPKWICSTDNTFKLDLTENSGTHLPSDCLILLCFPKFPWQELRI